MARVLLVFPNVECGYGKPKYPPLGLAYLAACFEKSEATVEVLDERTSAESFNEVLSSFKPTHVGFYASILTAEKVKKYLSEIKDVFTFVGGPQATINPNDFQMANIVIAGEGENSIQNILDSGSDTQNAPRIVNLDSIPFPAWHFFGKEFKTLPIMTTRGCPYNCIFCGVKKIFGQQYRKRSIDNIMREITDDVADFGMTHFEIIDDCFTLDKGFVKAFCNALINTGLCLEWDCVQGVRIDTLDEEALLLMKKSGCRMIGIGIESGEQKVVDAINKNLDLKKAEENIALAKKAGLVVKAFFVIGAPQDSYECVVKSVGFFKRCRIDVPRFGMLVPYPGTAMRDWVEKNGTMLVGDDAFTHGLEYEHVTVPFETKDFSKEEREKAYAYATEESEVWTIRMRFGIMAGWVARIKPVRKLAKKIYFESNFLKRTIWG